MLKFGLITRDLSVVDRLRSVRVAAVFPAESIEGVGAAQRSFTFIVSAKVVMAGAMKTICCCI